MANYDLLIFLLEQNLNKEMWLPTTSDPASAPFGLIRVIFSPVTIFPNL